MVPSVNPNFGPKKRINFINDDPLNELKSDNEEDVKDNYTDWIINDENMNVQSQIDSLVWPIEKGEYLYFKYHSRKYGSCLMIRTILVLTWLLCTF